MTFLDDTLPNFSEAREYHYRFLKYVIKRKLNGESVDNEFSHIKIMRRPIPDNVKDYLNIEKNLHQILIGKPQELEQIKDLFSNEVCIPLIFNYNKWTQGIDYYQNYHGYTLADKLNIPTCTYCNRLYTKTVSIPEKITRPQYDHWFPKSNYPILALSFYNLIPSCNVCNCSVKGNNDMTLDTHLHPYVDRDINFQFSFDHTDYSNFAFKINSLPGSRDENFVLDFKLREIYETHEDEIKDLRRLRDVYSAKYLDVLHKQFSILKISPDEIYRLAFGVYEDETLFNKRPLSRMKRDILIELGMIRKQNNGL